MKAVLARTSLFAPAPAVRLGLVRLGVGGFWLYQLLDTREDMIRLAGVDPALFQPVGVATLLDGAISPLLYAGLLDATIALGVAWTAGFAWRLVGPAFAGLLLFVTNYQLSWGQIHHDAHLPMLHVLALSLGPAAAGGSVDALLRRRWRAARWGAWQPAGEGWSWHYGWPLRLVCAVTTFTYLLAGLAKVTGDQGLGWASGENLRDQIAYSTLDQDLLGGSDGPRAVMLFYEHPWLLAPAAIGTLVLEIGAPFALLGGPLATGWVAGVIGMHWGIRALMAIVFPYPISGIAFLSFFPLERLLPASGRAILSR